MLYATSISVQIKEVFAVDIESCKVQLGDELGWVLNNSEFHWYNDIVS